MPGGLLNLIALGNQNIILKRCNNNIYNDSEHTLCLNKDIEKFIMNRPAVFMGV